MATLSGRLLFDRTRTGAPPSGMSGIANVTIVLQNTSTNMALGVTTDSNGNFSFINVPNGNYRIVESFLTSGIPTPGDFNLAFSGGVFRGVVPPINYVANPPAGTTDLDCTTPNTLLITIADANISNLYLCNGPVRYIPIENITDACAVIDPRNLLIDAESGTMGLFPQGTAVDTGVPEEPYPENVPDYIYTLPRRPGHAPEANEYTVQNIMKDDTSNIQNYWWRIADRTTGNETGRMMIVNGDRPGSVFFSTNVDVVPHTHYLFSVWILNMMRDPRGAEPKLGVEVRAEDGSIVYKETLGALIPTNVNVPEWKQVGTVLNTFDHTHLTLRFVSEGPEAIGNDYAIDNVTFQEVRVPIFTPQKRCNVDKIGMEEIATYTITLSNTCSNSLTAVTFEDMIPDGLTFIPDSVTINGVSVLGVNPEEGFNIPNIAGGERAIITFDVVATFIPEINPTTNRATFTYLYSPVKDGIPERFEVISNEVSLRINPPWCQTAFLALQRERNLQNIIYESDVITFDTPLVSTGGIVYQEDGKIDIIRRGTYLATWFVSGMSGLSTTKQKYKIQKFDYDTSRWVDLSGASCHLKIAATAGFAAIHVPDKEITSHGKVTIALSNDVTEDVALTSHQPKAGILVHGADFECTENRMITIANILLDVDTYLDSLQRFLFLSDVSELWSTTNELLGLGVAVISIGYNYNFWGIGMLNEAVQLSEGVKYYLARSSQYVPLTFYQGDPTIGALWIEEPGGANTKYPLRFDGTGVYILPHIPMSLPAGTKFSFTQTLILVDPML